MKKTKTIKVTVEKTGKNAFDITFLEGNNGFRLHVGATFINNLRKSKQSTEKQGHAVTDKTGSDA